MLERTCCIPGIGSVMGSAVIQAQSGWESNATFKSILFYECPCTIFDVIGDVGHRHSGSYEFPGALSHLPMHLSGTSDIVVSSFRIFIGQLLYMPFFFRCGTVRITALRDKSSEISGSAITHSFLYSWSSPSG